jgi:hypothetical protein
MTKYQVVFHYSIEIEADDENEAEDSAYALFVERLADRGLSASEFPAVVEEVI